MKPLLQLGTAFLLVSLLAGCGPDARVGRVELVGAPAGEASFVAGETVTATIELTEAYEGLRVRATWYRGSTQLAEETLATPRRTSASRPVSLTFALATEATWPPGAYRCDLFVPDQGTQSLPFILKAPQ